MELKTLSLDAVPRALEKADRYRLLNEPVQAQSICLDILRVDPTNQKAIEILLLALTDQFVSGYTMDEMAPESLIGRFNTDYQRAYYSGIIAERRAEAALDRDVPQAEFVAHEQLTAAMKHYEAADGLSEPGNEDAVLRWNTCARLMNSQRVQARGEEEGERLGE
jgi:hypothetical protein